jgi:hypothetical protein
MLHGLFDSALTYQRGGQLYVVKIIYQSSDVMFSEQMPDSPLPLPLELPYFCLLCFSHIEVSFSKLNNFILLWKIMLIIKSLHVEFRLMFSNFRGLCKNYLQNKFIFDQTILRNFFGLAVK